MVFDVVVFVVGLAIGAIVGALVYRNNSALFDKLMAPYLQQYEKTQADLLKELAAIKEKLGIK